MVATRWLSQRLEQDVRAEEEAELYRLESGGISSKERRVEMRRNKLEKYVY